ncbi:hypothetical protein BJ508DRAFT_211068 [Ascobolus immersus RN42]|uniref:Fungal N-terminal domain-containing protein n=1 Tax=Ascobolus immersus RN42 TaxID=1160509 RepID=A0A3N4I099_ASCIM|nr:hypothetical protein BJ508DRAFT_211068 [Ascobolus immersus RN42]
MSLGDFIAAADLARRLYKDLYQVARRAPQELKELQLEINNLKSAIEIMEEELVNPKSILRQSGDSRTKLLESIAQEIRELLEELHGVWKKYNDHYAEAGKSKLKDLMAGIGLARKLPELNRYRAKVCLRPSSARQIYEWEHKSLLQFQSSLDSIDNNIQDIKDMIGMNRTERALPMVSDMIGGAEGQSIDWMFLTRKFARNAEEKRNWASIGVSEWINAGRWWLMQVPCPNLLCGIQLMNDTQSQQALQKPKRWDPSAKGLRVLHLVKAAWILIEVVILHPQLSFLETEMRSEVKILSDVRKRFYLQTLNSITYFRRSQRSFIYYGHLHGQQSLCQIRSS